jgi:hypothetical protein
MAKSQKHSNREAKKPKQVKVAAPPAAASIITRGTAGPQPKKR